MQFINSQAKSEHVFRLEHAHIFVHLAPSGNIDITVNATDAAVGLDRPRFMSSSYVDVVWAFCGYITILMRTNEVISDWCTT